MYSTEYSCQRRILHSFIYPEDDIIHPIYNVGMLLNYNNELTFKTNVLGETFLRSPTYLHRAVLFHNKLFKTMFVSAKLLLVVTRNFSPASRGHVATTILGSRFRIAVLITCLHPVEYWARHK